ncbi:FAD-dependent oxidoreductase [candidate division MSBL1 archaeon SCGC-AAA382C18]|uniref:FAD-dependent oxidoreductase n=1 Tax=candidate division MSBL1 archaeon SCGC-AAA382C18 TaxID=1698281 RepID=A0A133VK16_9EURY|nr:FAD-dependent oxidoreductase [candidate division MSBL1 archaeon SCGC-AAA382C18]
MKDVVIIGAGPAGLFAAKELSGKSDLSIMVIEKGKSINNRKSPYEENDECPESESYDVMQGVGGTGLMSDGTLNLSPYIGGDLTGYVSGREAKKIIENIDNVFQKHGAPKKIYGEDKKETEKLARKAAAADVKFIPIKQRHMGSENLPAIITSFKEDLEDKGVDFLLESRVAEIEEDGVVLETGEKIEARYILAAPGRAGAIWLAEQADKLGLNISHGAIDVGVRVEVPSIVMEPVIEVSRDPKFHIRTKSFDDFVRTFCTNHEGFIVKENYGDYVGVNGHSLKSKKSNNTNFAFLSRVKLTEPVTNTTAYGESIGRLATTIGGGRPVVQRIGDLRNGQRSTPSRIERGHVEPTLKDVTPGDISMALPGRIVTSLQEALDQLDNVVPGVASNSTLLYSPEVKLYAMQISVNDLMQTDIDNLFVAGDGAGLSRDIVNASATGVLAARGIMKESNR